jgi:hypothetical protein
MGKSLGFVNWQISMQGTDDVLLSLREFAASKAESRRGFRSAVLRKGE